MTKFKTRILFLSVVSLLTFMVSGCISEDNKGYPERLYIPVEGERLIIHGKEFFRGVTIRDSKSDEYGLGHEEDGHITATYKWLTVESSFDDNSVVIAASTNDTNKKRKLTIEGDFGNAYATIIVYQAAN